MTSGYVLSLNRDVEVLKLLYLLPDGRRLKRWCAGWEGSTMIFLAFLINRDEKREESEGRLAPMILDALRTTLSSLVLFHEVVLPNQTRMENVRTLSIVAL